MARSVQVRAVKQVPWKRANREDPGACGFCTILVQGGVVRHELCPGKHCACHDAGHPATGNPALDQVG